MQFIYMTSLDSQCFLLPDSFWNWSSNFHWVSKYCPSFDLVSPLWPCSFIQQTFSLAPPKCQGYTRHRIILMGGVSYCWQSLTPTHISVRRLHVHLAPYNLLYFLEATLGLAMGQALANGKRAGMIHTMSRQKLLEASPLPADLLLLLFSLKTACSRWRWFFLLNPGIWRHIEQMAGWNRATADLQWDTYVIRVKKKKCPLLTATGIMR